MCPGRKASAHYSGISLGIIGAVIKKNNFGIMGLKFEDEPSPIKVQSLNERPSADEPGHFGRHDRMGALDSVGDSQLSYTGV